MFTWQFYFYIDRIWFQKSESVKFVWGILQGGETQSWFNFTEISQQSLSHFAMNLGRKFTQVCKSKKSRYHEGATLCSRGFTSVTFKKKNTYNLQPSFSREVNHGYIILVRWIQIQKSSAEYLSLILILPDFVSCRIRNVRDGSKVYFRNYMASLCLRMTRSEGEREVGRACNNMGLLVRCLTVSPSFPFPITCSFVTNKQCDTK